MDPFANMKAPEKTKVIKIIKVVGTLIVIGILLLNTIFVLNSGEEAVITRFGAYQSTEATPGLKLKIPFIDDAQIVNVEQIRRMEFGYRSEGNAVGDFNAESIMLTGDENLVIADWAIQFRVKNSYNFLFKVDDVLGTFRVIAESSYRRVVAAHPLDDILTNQKDIIQSEIMTDLQSICDKYDIGVQITAVQLQDALPPDEVKEAFIDVSSAKEEKTAKINEAMKYENEKLPVARGDAAKLTNEAEGYKQQRINQAMGTVARFNAIQAEYANNPSIMSVKLYLEMITDVMPRISGVYFTGADGDILKFLPLNNNFGGAK